MGLFSWLNTNKNSEQGEKVNFGQVFEEIKQNSLHMTFLKSSKVAPNASRFGGQPDLPLEYKWPYFTAEYHDGTGLGQIESRPLSFLLQINLAELSDLDVEQKLPSSGMLYFFYEMKTQVWGFDPKDKGSALVYYFDGDLSVLKNRPFPADLEEKFRYPQHMIRFHSKYEIPHFDEYNPSGGQQECDEYCGAAAQMGFFDNSEENSNGEHKLLGYANLIQGDMLTDCQLATNGIYCGASEGYQTVQAEELLKDRSDWILLAQISSIDAGSGFELLFGDMGTIYFYIKKQDLEQKNFNSIWLVLQCG